MENTIENNPDLYWFFFVFAIYQKAGAIAGCAVDTVCFCGLRFTLRFCIPLILQKLVWFVLISFLTNKQSKSGFVKSGGFKGVYHGLSSVLIGSAPSAAIFFVTYETLKTNTFLSRTFEHNPSVLHMISASFGEIMACSIRVPTEIIKQRMQTGRYQTLVSAISNIKTHNGLSGFYRGFSMTIFREIPFACIQFPLYESFKKNLKKLRKEDVGPLQAAFCGSVAGGIAAACTTPLDVIKTRIMLSKESNTKISHVYRNIIEKEGFLKLFSGIGPRVAWVGLGGFIFLGTYEKVKSIVS